MTLQLIICVEADSKSKSDYMYISSTIKQFYKLDSSIRLSPVFMGGKSHYNSSKVKKEIESNIRQYKTMNRDSRNHVLLCVDCDRYDQSSEDHDFLENVKKYCEDNGYFFVWFCRNIEQVYLGESVKNEKKKEAERFLKKQMIQRVDQNHLRAKIFKIKHSNLCLILDELLHEK